MDHTITHRMLPRFLTISVVLHLGVLLEISRSPLIMPNHHLGQSVLDVRLQGYAPSPTPTPPLHTMATPLTTNRSGVHAASPTATIVSATSSVPTSDTESHTPASMDKTKAGLHNQLLGELKTHLSRYLTYPPLARINGWEGMVLLSLRVESDGQLDKIHLERSSGYAVLDDSAVNSLKRVGNLVEARAWMEGNSIDMQLPVIYKLIEN